MRSAPGELGEPIEIAPLGHLRRPGHEIVALDNGGEFWRGAEEASRFACGKSGKPSRLEISGGAVGCLDHRGELGGQLCGEPEAVTGLSQAVGRLAPIW